MCNISQNSPFFDSWRLVRKRKNFSIGSRKLFVGYGHLVIKLAISKIDKAMGDGLRDSVY